MKITIKGITPSTIAFNTLGIVVRGDSSSPELYPESVARNIDVLNQDQISEINALLHSKLISVEIEDSSSPQATHIDPSLLVSCSSPSENIPVQEKVQTTKKGRGRPKGSKNKSVKRVDSGDKSLETSSAVVMTPSGPKTGMMKKSSSGENSESEKTKASIEAMHKIEEEERLEKNLPDVNVDESNLNESEKMGLEAVVASHGENSKVEMVNSVVPEAKEIKERSVEFIDKNDFEEDDAGFLEF